MKNKILDSINYVFENCPELYKTIYSKHKERIVFELSLICKSGNKIIDLGGGIGIHSVVGQLSGCQFICIDNMISKHKGQIDCVEFAKSHGVHFIERNLFEYDLVFHNDYDSYKNTSIGTKTAGHFIEDNSIDSIVTFDCMEHLHHSPRNIYKQFVKKLKKGGKFFIGVPNAANILKRIRCLVGENIWSNINDWYFETEFRGHVREPIVKDLKLIMDDLELVNQKIYGRNFIGVQKYGKIFYPFGYVLQYLPSFCSNIYILGEKG